MSRKIHADPRFFINFNENYSFFVKRYAYAADFPLVLSNCYYDKLDFKYKIENNMDLYEKLKDRLLKKTIEASLYSTMMKYFANISLSQYENLKSNESLLEVLIRDEKERRERKNKKGLMEKAKGNTLEECISNLKGKDKDIYLQKLDKKLKYEEKKNESCGNK